MLKDHILRLNSEQRKAVSRIEGPVLILAGPGTGKTQLLSVRAASIVEEGAATPENILILTFTNAATKAMRERLGHIMGVSGYRITVDTFHGFANSIINESEELVEYISRRIHIDDVEATKAFEYILDNYDGLSAIRPFNDPYYYVKYIRKGISQLKNEGISPDEFASIAETAEPDNVYVKDKHLPRLKALAVCYRAYEELKRGDNPDVFDDRGRYDYDDMIMVAREAIASEASLREDIQRTYTHIMVDEFQDTNGAQLKMLFSLLPEGSPNICCVGDDDQSIYRFQGANIENFKIFEKRFPGVIIINLVDNYRSPQSVLDVSGKVIQSIPEEERIADKNLKSVKGEDGGSVRVLRFDTEEEEIAYIISLIEKAAAAKVTDPVMDGHGRYVSPYNDIAVLVRKRKHITKLIDAFLRSGLPYCTDGREDITGEKRVMQLMDVLNLAAVDLSDIKISDQLFYRFLTHDYMRIDHADVLKFIEFAHNREDRRTVTLLRIFLELFESGDNMRGFGGGDFDVSDKVTGLGFNNPNSLYRASYCVKRLLEYAHSKPVHYTLLQFIEDSGLYSYVLDEYRSNKVLKIRDLRALTAFITRVKETDLSKPGLRLDEFLEDVKTRQTHGIPLTGEVVTGSQDGVRIITAHGAKGLEFDTVIIPFCLNSKSWPVRPTPDLIPLPRSIYTSSQYQERDKAAMTEHDETRLFYVAMTRARRSLVFTATPQEEGIISPFIPVTGIDVEEGIVPEEESFLVDRLILTGKEDPFIGTEKILEDLVRNMKLTPTMLNNYIFCSRKFLYTDVLLLPGKKRQSLIFGNCAHKAAEGIYIEYMKTGRFPDAGMFKYLFMNELKYQGADDSTRKGCIYKFENSLLDWFERERRDPVMPLGLEQRLSTVIGGEIDFIGKYDKLEMEDESSGLVRVIDYKSGNPDKHIKAIESCRDIRSDDCDGYMRQLVAYKLLYDRYSEKKGLEVSHGVLAFFEPVRATVKKYGMTAGDYMNVKVRIEAYLVNELESYIIDIWKSIKSLKFDKLSERDGKKCPFCDYDSICWG